MHLVYQLRFAHLGKVLMSPGVTGDLVTVSVHSTEYFRISGLVYVHLALSHVVARDEKGGFGVVAGQHVEKMPGEVERPVIEGQCNVVVGQAVVYPGSFVCDVSYQWAWYIESIESTWLRVSVATVAIVQLASWPGTVVIALSAVFLH